MKSEENIYRVGTFMRYFLSENTSRLLEDSLLTTFDDYIYDENIDTSYERFKKIGIEYLLIDLNAATIDKDPEKRLTQRYENMLQFLTHENIKLIETDSACLKTALINYERSQDLGNYTSLAGVNYNGTTTSSQKKELCVRTIVEIIRSEDLLPSYPHL